MRKKVFFGPENGIWKNMFADVFADKSYEYCSFETKISKKSKRIILSKKVVNKLPHPIKRILYKKILNYPFFKERDSELLFLFSNGYEMFADREGFLIFCTFLKKEYKKCRLCLHIYEAMQTEDSRKFVSECKKIFDVILTFNRYDAIEQGLEYYGPVNECGIISPQGDGEESDVFFAGGVSAGRYNLIIETFKWLSDHGKKCVFFFPTSKERIKEYFEQLSYCLNINVPLQDECCIEYKRSKFYFGRYIPYAWALSYILKTKVMLEIIVLNFGRASCTNRLAQAMAYEKKLLTNSIITKEEPYFNEHNISVFSKPEDIDLTFFDTDFEKIDKDFSCVHMLKYMEYRAYGNVYNSKTNIYDKISTVEAIK